MSPRLFWKVLCETFTQWMADRVPRLGASLAYYSVFSLGPLLLIAIAIAGLVFHSGAQEGILHEITATMGPTVGQAVSDILHNVHLSGGSVTATILGIIVLFFGASGVFIELQDSLNTIWKVAPRPDLGWWELIRERLLSISVVLGTGFLLLVSLVISATITALSRWLTFTHGESAAFGWHLLNFLLSFALISFLFALIYKVLPDARVRWRDVWIGAVLTAFLFTLGKYAISVYLVQTGVSSAFGAAGSVIVILTWVYYSAQILLFGAEFTRVYAQTVGEPIQPAAHAVAVPSATGPGPGTPPPTTPAQSRKITV